MLDIKTIHTIRDMSAYEFNKHLSKVVSDLQQDGLVVEVQYQTTSVETIHERRSVTEHSALIIGRGK